MNSEAPRAKNDKIVSVEAQAKAQPEAKAQVEEGMENATSVPVNYAVARSTQFTLLDFNAALAAAETMLNRAAEVLSSVSKGAEVIKEATSIKEEVIEVAPVAAPELTDAMIQVDVVEPIKNDIEILATEVSLPAKDNKKQDNLLKVEEGPKFDDKVAEVAQSDEVQDIIEKMRLASKGEQSKAAEKTVDISVEKPQVEKVEASSVKDALGDDSWLDKASNEKSAPEEENSQGGRGV